MPSSFQILSGYVSSFVLQRLARNPQPIAYPLREHGDAAVLFVDLVNFTALSDYENDERHHGAEKLSRLLQTYFSHVINTIHAYGGHVVRFAGDAVIAIWPTAPEEPHEQAVRLATQAGAALHSNVSAFSPEGLRVVVGFGQVKSLHIGGPPNHWQWLLAGDPMVQITNTKVHTRPNQVVLSAEAWQLVAPYCIGVELDQGIHRLIVIGQELEPTPTIFPILSRQARTTLLSYIPTFILDRQLGAQTTWLAEIRSATVLFIHIPNIIYTSPDMLDLMQIAWNTVQQVLATFSGYMVQFIVDDKGTNIIAAFGLPPYVHEDDPRRAVRAAMTIAQRLSHHELQAAIGVETGKVFCGDCGVPEHWEYSIIGSTINLSARLMQVALDQNCMVVCGAETYRAIREQIECVELGTVQVKGVAQPITVYQPLQLTKYAPRFTSIIGREQEQAQGYQAVQDYVADGKYRCMLIEGEAGIGKSRLLLDIAQHAEQYEMRVISVAADALDQRVPFAVWREIVLKLLSFDVITEPSNQHLILSNLLADQPNASHQITLLNQLFGTVGNDQRTAHTGANYLASLFQTLHIIIARLLDQQITIITIDDAHWSDESSWELTNYLANAMPSVLLLIGTRPFAQNPPPMYLNIRRHPATHVLVLKPISDDAMTELAKQRLGVSSVAPDVLLLLQTKAAGNPFFAEELLYGMRDAKTIDDVTLTNDMPQTVLTLPDFPRAIERVIASRVAVLDFPTQLALKVASVIGRSFNVQLLQKVFPLSEFRHRVIDFLYTCEEHHLIQFEEHTSELRFTFRHIITHEIVYNSMLTTQRRELHRQIGLVLERTENFTSHDGLYELAMHFRQGELWDKAVNYLLHVGQHAYNVGSLASAYESYAEALWCAQQIETDASEQILDIMLRMLQVGYSPENTPHTLAAMSSLLATTTATLAKTPDVERLEIQIHFMLGRLYFAASALPVALQHFKYVAQGHSSTLPDMHLLARGYVGRIWIMQGWMAKGTQEIQTVLPLLKQAGRMGEVSILRCYLGFGLAAMGNYREGVALGQKTVAKIAIVRHHSAWVFCTTLLMMTYWQGGDYQSAITLANSILEESQPTSDPAPLHTAYCTLCWSHLRSGAVQTAQAIFAEYCERRTQWQHASPTDVWFEGVRLELLLAAGQSQDVIQHIAAVIQHAHDEENHFLVGVLNGILGRAYAAQQDWAASEAAFQESVAVLQRFQIMLECGYVLLQWSTHLSPTANPQRVADLREQAKRIFIQADVGGCSRSSDANE